MLDSVTLQTARTIAQAINSYSGKSVDFDSVCKHVEQQTQASKSDIIATMQFIQELHGTQDIPITGGSTGLVIDVSTPLDLADEIRYNYAVGKALLKSILEQDKADAAEEIRKTLREISRFLEGMLKMQERVFNLQQIQKFQEAVMQILEKQTPELRNEVVQLLIASDL